MAQLPINRYDRIGLGYERRRQSDPCIGSAIHAGLGGAKTILNVGAGTGSYEPRDRLVVAVEPSITMITQRPHGTAPAVQARAEKLPFAADSFDAVLAVLTMQHWADWRAGVAEMRRVSRDRMVILTWDPEADTAWLGAYFSHLIEADRRRFPLLAALRALLGEVEVTAVPVPEDCTDGFMCAYWRRPAAYLDPQVRAAISAFATYPSHRALSKLSRDLDRGVWARRYGDGLPRGAIDLGYRLVTRVGCATRD